MPTKTHLIQTSNHDDVCIITGVDWLDSTGSDVEKGYLKDHKIPKPVIIRNSVNGEEVQSGVFSYAAIKKKYVYSAGQLFAYGQQLSSLYFENTPVAAHSTWVVVEKLDDLYWLCLISSGQVVSETKELLTKEYALQKSDEYNEFAQGSNLDLCYVGSGVSDFIENESEVVTLEILLDKLSPEELKDFAVKPRGQTSTTTKLAVGVIASFLVHILVTKSGFFSTGPTPEEEHKQQVKNATEIVQSYYDSILARPSIKDAVTALSTALKNSKYLEAPWPIHQINCSVDQSSCLITYKNPHNIPVDLIEAFVKNRCDTYSITPQGAASTCSFTLPLPVISHHDAGSRIHNFTNYLMTFSNVGFTTEISNPQKSAIPGSELAPENSFYQEGAWKISGSYVDAINLANKLNGIDWVNPRNIQLTINESSSLNSLLVMIEGSYVVK